VLPEKVDGQSPRQAENFIHSALFHNKFAWHDYGDELFVGYFETLHLVAE